MRKSCERLRRVGSRPRVGMVGEEGVGGVAGGDLFDEYQAPFPALWRIGRSVGSISRCEDEL